MAEIKVNYEYYHSTFNCGGESIIPPEAFPLWRKRAYEIVFSQISQPPSPYHTDAVSDSICAVAELLYKSSKRDGLKAESIDGYSVTYSESKTLSADINALIRKYLGNTGLLFRGV